MRVRKRELRENVKGREKKSERNKSAKFYLFEKSL